MSKMHVKVKNVATYMYHKILETLNTYLRTVTNPLLNLHNNFIEMYSVLVDYSHYMHGLFTQTYIF